MSTSLLAEEGAVNAPVAKQLAVGALERSPASLAIAVTGVLGPTEDEDGHPVGLLYFCVVIKGSEPKVVREDLGNQSHDLLLEHAIYRTLELIEISVTEQCAAR